MKNRVRNVVAALCVVLTLVVAFAPQQAKAASNTWVNRNGGYYYLDSNGKTMKNRWVKYKGDYYYLGFTGRMVTNAWVQYNGAYYYLGKDGKPVVNNWVRYLGFYYYLNENGNPVVSDYIKYNDDYYFFGPTGACILQGSTIENFYNSLDYSQRAEFLTFLFNVTGISVPDVFITLLSYQDLDLDVVMGLVDLFDIEIDMGSIFLNMISNLFNY